MRIRAMIKFLTLILVAFSMTTLLIAGPRANPKKGKVFFRKYCRVCHDGSSDVIKLDPVSKTMEQWGREFEEGGAAEACIPRVEEKESYKLTAQDMLDIQSYLVSHAADSDQPATCGN